MGEPIAPDEARSPVERAIAPRWRAARLALDAVLFGAASYGAIRAALLLGEGVLEPAGAAARLAPCFAVVVGLVLTAPLDRPLAPKRRWLGRLGELAAFALFVWIPTWAQGRAPLKGESYLWLAGEWLKLPENFLLIARVSPLGTAASALGFAALMVFVARADLGRRRAALALVAVLAVVAMIRSTGANPNNQIVYFIIYAMPWVVCAVGLARGRTRLASRSGAVGWVMGHLLVFYVGVLPVGHAGFDERPGVDKIYPPAGEESAVPLGFLRSFVHDPSRGMLYTAFGPTSGVLALEIDAGVLRTIDIHDGLVRHLWTEPELDHILALDWIWGDLLEIGKQPFEIRARHDIYSARHPVPMSFLVGREEVAVVFTEMPMVATVDRARLEAPSEEPVPFRSELDLRAEGLTRFRSGAWNAVGDVDAGELYVQLGPVDLEQRFVLLRIDLHAPDGPRVVATAPVPDGGLAILSVPEHDAILTAGFFTDRIFEYDATTLELRRTIRGPRNCRALAYDPRRDRIVATAFLPGELWFLDWQSGEPALRERVGNKSMSLHLDAERDVLYLASQEGVFAVGLAEHLDGHLTGGTAPPSGASPPP